LRTKNHDRQPTDPHAPHSATFSAYFSGSARNLQ
jgi:hypothetical protein